MIGNDDYSDIINMEHHVSAIHPQMSIANRAAQFAPFAALTGYDSAVNETGRLTHERIELDDNAREILDNKFLRLREDGTLFVKLSYFLKDLKKEGGEYVTIEGSIKKLDDYTQHIIMKSGEVIAYDDILDIEIR